MYNKYGNRKVFVCGIQFDSKKEATRYLILKQMEKAGLIKDLELQKKYVLIPAQKIDGRLVERECSYVADFVYKDIASGNTVVEDTKGFRTDVYKLKKKMMLYFHGILITEV